VVLSSSETGVCIFLCVELFLISEEIKILYFLLFFRLFFFPHDAKGGEKKISHLVLSRASTFQEKGVFKYAICF